MTRIDKKFIQLKKNKRKAFIAFITAGFPSIDKTFKLVLELEKKGVDIIELGVPFSDPLADGAVIQNASKLALEKKVDIDKIFKVVEKIRLYYEIPIALMTYYNPVLFYGETKFLKRARFCGVDGLIIPDLPLEESIFLFREAKKNKINLIQFISPTTPLARMKKIASSAHGFIYYVSVTGVTGARKSLSCGIKKNISLIKSITDKPVCIVFGISTPAQVKSAASFSDGVIVGSSIVDVITKYSKKSNLEHLIGNFVATLIKPIGK